jgi:ectoine hydroxylase-related dioxygenase (phytanoyl-CoA dioxygenase family)
MFDILKTLGRERRRVDRIASKGQFRDAFNIGQAMNRRRRDAALELSLRDWRHLAFYESQEGEGRADWPPEFSDPWPGLNGQIPEIGRGELSTALLGGAIHHHGSLIVRGLVPPSRVADYVAAIDDVFASRAAHVAGASAARGADYVPFEPKHGRSIMSDREFTGDFAVLMADAPRFFTRWVDELDASTVLAAVSGYLGERPALSATKTTLYHLPAHAGAQWHQDGAFLGDDIRTVNLWVACSECGVDAPGLDIIPWRLDKIVETGTHGSLFHWSVGEGLVEKLAGPRAIATPRFMPGDAILFDQLCLHRTGARPTMTRGRYAVETWMFAPSHFRDGVPLSL